MSMSDMKEGLFIRLLKNNPPTYRAYCKNGHVGEGNTPICAFLAYERDARDYPTNSWPDANCGQESE